MTYLKLAVTRKVLTTAKCHLEDLEYKYGTEPANPT